jgi:hypothetical protein
LVVFALLCRILLLPAAPADDVYRYVWEGRVRLAGFNPYLVPPDDAGLAHLRDAGWPRINHPEHSAIYGPAVEALFAAVAWASPTAGAMKLLALGGDSLTIMVLLRWLRRARLDPRLASIYALCPLTLWTFAQRGHIDSVMLAAMTSALYLVDHPGRSRWRSATLSGAALGVAIGVKWVPLMLLPWWVMRQIAPAERLQSSAARAGIGMLAMLGMLVLAFAPYADAGTRLLGPVMSFAQNFCTLDFGQRCLAVALGADGAQIGAVLVALFSSLIAAVRRLPAGGCTWPLGLTLLMLPTIHPWYLTWLLPLLSIRPSLPWLLLPVTMIAALEGDHLRETAGVWRMPDWVQYAVFVPFVVALTLCAGTWRRRRGAPVEKSGRLKHAFSATGNPR